MPELFLAVVFSAIPGLIAPSQSSAARALGLLPDYAGTLGMGRVRTEQRVREEPTTLEGLGFRTDGRKLTMGRDLSLDIASVNSRIALIGADNFTPLRRTGWESEESLKLPFNRTFFVVGKFGADSGSLEQQ